MQRSPPPAAADDLVENYPKSQLDAVLPSQQHGPLSPKIVSDSSKVKPNQGESIQHRHRLSHPTLHHLEHHPALHWDRHRTTRPLSCFNPTKAHFSLPKSSEVGTKADAISYKWTSRNNRKGRHALTVKRDALHPALQRQIPPATSTLKHTCRGIWRMLTVYPVWDISYDVAAVFTLGSVIWVINAFFAFLSLVRPESEFKNEALYAGGITAFVGATVFVWGSVLLMLEAVNTNNTGCFGWATERIFSEGAEDTSETLHIRPEKSVCTHHHPNKHNIVGKGNHEKPQTSATTPSSNSKSWAWWPSMAELRAHYIHEIGFAASFTQLVAASIFEIAGLTALPGIYNRMSRPVAIIFYWTPQVIGGFGFIVSGALFMLETQTRWYKPAFKTLGWWIGAFNMIGGFGFTLCPAFGYDENSWAQYQASLSTFWGSWAFLIGSVIQWYESLGKYPVEVV